MRTFEFTVNHAVKNSEDNVKLSIQGRFNETYYVKEVQILSTVDGDYEDSVNITYLMNDNDGQSNRLCYDHMMCSKHIAHKLSNNDYFVLKLLAVEIGSSEDHISFDSTTFNLYELAEHSERHVNDRVRYLSEESK